MSLGISFLLAMFARRLRRCAAIVLFLTKASSIIGSNVFRDLWSQMTSRNVLQSCACLCVENWHKRHQLCSSWFKLARYPIFQNLKNISDSMAIREVSTWEHAARGTIFLFGVVWLVYWWTSSLTGLGFWFWKFVSGVATIFWPCIRQWYDVSNERKM